MSLKKGWAQNWYSKAQQNFKLKQQPVTYIAIPKMESLHNMFTDQKIPTITIGA